MVVSPLISFLSESELTGLGISGPQQVPSSYCPLSCKVHRPSCSLTRLLLGFAFAAGGAYYHIPQDGSFCFVLRIQAPAFMITLGADMQGRIVLQSLSSILPCFTIFLANIFSGLSSFLFSVCLSPPECQLSDNP